MRDSQTTNSQYASREELARVESSVGSLAESVKSLSLTVGEGFKRLDTSIERVSLAQAGAGRIGLMPALAVCSFVWAIVAASVGWAATQHAELKVTQGMVETNQAYILDQAKDIEVIDHLHQETRERLIKLEALKP